MYRRLRSGALLIGPRATTINLQKASKANVVIDPIPLKPDI